MTGSTTWSKRSPNKRIKHGTANSLLGSASLHILANYYQPLMRALAGTTSSIFKCAWLIEYIATNDW